MLTRVSPGSERSGSEPSLPVYCVTVARGPLRLRSLTGIGGYEPLPERWHLDIVFIMCLVMEAPGCFDHYYYFGKKERKSGYRMVYGWLLREK